MDTQKQLLVVVGVDGSVASDRALAWAERIGHRLGATVEVVTAWTNSRLDNGGMPILPLADEDSARRAQAEVAARVIPGGGSTPVAMGVVEGSPGPALVEAAHRADLLVVGSHGHGRMYSAVMGSTSEYCIRHAGCPVVVIPVPLRQADGEHDDVALAR